MTIKHLATLILAMAVALSGMESTRLWAEENHGNHKGHAASPASAEAVSPPAKEPELEPELEKKACEHKIPQIECDECRYELGVVKVDPAVTGVLIKTARVELGEMARTLRLTGEVQYDPTRRVEVLPPAAGRVLRVKARLGQHVEQGEVLAVLESGELGEAKAAYLEALTVADMAQQEQHRQELLGSALEKLLQRARNSTGELVSPGSEPLGEWKSKWVAAMTRLRQARIQLEREKSLVASQASSKADLEAAEREHQTSQADYTALTEELELNLQLDGLKAKNAVRLANAKRRAAAQRLALFGLTDTAIAAMASETTADTAHFSELEIKAPRAGVVTAWNLTEGQMTEPAQRLFTITDTTNVWVWCDLYERDLGVIHERLERLDRKALPATLRVAAFDDAFAGQVDLVESAVNETTRTLKLRVQVANAEGKLRPGMFASIRLPLANDGQVLLVPRHAVLRDEGASFAFIH